MKKSIVFCLLVSLVLIYAVSALANDAMTYSVKDNDYLIRIGERLLKHPEDWKKVAGLNGLEPPYVIVPGQKLTIPYDLLKGAPFKAETAFVSGDVSVNRDDGRGWVTLDAGVSVGPDAILRTGKKSVAELQYADGSSVRLLPETELLIESSLREGDERSSRRFFVRIGRTAYKVARFISRLSEFSVHSPTSVIGVRGTHFRYVVDRDESNRAEVLDGHVMVGAQGKTVELDAGEGTLVKKGQPPLPPVALPGAPVLKGLAPRYQNIDPIPLRFDPVPNAKTYRLVLARDENMTSWVLEKFISPGDVIRLLEKTEGDYFLTLTSINEVGLEGIPSTLSQFTLWRQRLMPPELISVLDSRLRNGMVSCRWKSVEGAANYQVQAMKDGGSEMIVQDHSEVKGSSISLDQLDVGTGYNLRVRSVDAQGYPGEWSQIRNLPAYTD